MILHIGRSSAATMVALLVLLAGVAVDAGTSQDAPARPTDIERMVQEGQLEALDSRLAGGKSPDEKALLAEAATHRAGRQRDTRSRSAAFEEAEKRYLRWIEACETNPSDDPEKRQASASAARVAYAGMILSRWIAPDLDEHELTGGRRGDTVRLIATLLKAKSAYEKAQKDLDPLIRELEAGAGNVEERYLTLGIFDSIQRIRLDLRFNQAWCNYFVAHIDTRNAEQRSAALAAAERAFRELSTMSDGETAARCWLGLALVQRESRRYEDAAKSFSEAMRAAAGSPIEAQVLYERSRMELDLKKYEEARKSLASLAEKDLDNLSEADKPLRFYINLAHLWDANSYLMEGDRLRDQSATSSAQEALLRRAERLRESGIAKMNRLASRGGEWGSIVALYVAATIKPDANPKGLTPSELLFSARQLSEQKKFRHALERLTEARGRRDLSPDLEAEVLFEIGLCEYQSHQQRAAADAFSTLVQKHKSHPRAADAATYAYELWAGVAEDSKKPEDYAALAAALTAFVDGYPQHEKRDEALWWLPITLASAGKFADAAQRFSQISPASVRWEEAQFRVLSCRRQDFEARREAMSPVERQSAVLGLVKDLSKHATDALQRAAKSRDSAATLRWSASSLLSAAELEISLGQCRAEPALAMLENFEKSYPGSELTARALAVRISALRGLRRFDEATKVVEQFLKTVPAAQAGGVLAGVARGLLEEADRLESSGDDAALRQLATGAIATFEQLQAWAAADESRTEHRDAIEYSLARMRYLAGDLAPAREAIAKLREKDPRSGHYHRLNALVLSASLGEAPTPAQLLAAREAWSDLLRDPNLRIAEPQRYWEARYQFLRLLLREGHHDDVLKAIRQERVWHADLGGAAWKRRFEELERSAGGGPVESADPASQASSRSLP